MAVWQASNVMTGTPEKPKYTQAIAILEIWSVAVTTALAAADTILGPTLPAGCYMTGLTIAADDLDSGTAITFKAGYTGATTAFIATSPILQTGGIVGATVPGTNGFTAATDTQILLTILVTAGTPVAGTIRIMLAYVASP